MSNTANVVYFWTRPTDARISARRDIQAACGDWGDSSGEGFSVLLRKGTRADVEAAAAQHDLKVVREWWTITDGCRTVLALEIEAA